MSLAGLLCALEAELSKHFPTFFRGLISAVWIFGHCKVHHNQEAFFHQPFQTRIAVSIES